MLLLVAMVKQKIFFILSVLCVLYSCKNEVSSPFISMSDVVHRGDSVGMPSLIYFSEDIEGMSRLSKMNSDSFFYYQADRPMETAVGKILQPTSYPFYIIVRGDSVSSLFFQADKTLTSDVETVTYLNAMLRLSEMLEHKKSIEMNDVDMLSLLVERENKFYGKYLLAQLYKQIDAKKADEMYGELWRNSSQMERDAYPEEFIEIMKEKDRILRVNKTDIVFSDTLFDFGRIKSYEKVECQFYFVNHSSNRFVIHSIVSTCGCTVPSWNRQPIMPGQKDSISVRFKSSDKGFNQKTIVIKGNCDSDIKLRIRAEVV